VPLDIDLVDHRGERRRLAGSRRSRDEDEAARTFGERREDGRQPELVEAFDFLWDDAVDRGDGAALVEDVAAEARKTADTEREVELERLLEPLLLLVG
jgi:hypothetical protein